MNNQQNEKSNEVIPCTLRKPKISERNLVVMVGGIPKTTSLIVAETFGKEHKHVLRDIQGLDCSEHFNRSNFELVEYKDAKGESRPMYEMTRDGFTILAMGYTGKKAMQFKEIYIAAFNAMEILTHPILDWLVRRLNFEQSSY
jgi:Rha family phage regulatory protein